MSVPDLLLRCFIVDSVCKLGLDLSPSMFDWLRPSRFSFPWTIKSPSTNTSSWSFLSPFTFFSIGLAKDDRFDLVSPGVDTVEALEEALLLIVLDSC